MSKFLVYCMKTYYAGLVEYVIVFDIPMVFNGKKFLFRNLK
jgi:hypothetical protein